MPRSDPTPVWVLQKTRELVARATPAHIIAGIITAAGYPANARQVRRWKEKHGIKSQWAGDDGQLDQIMQQLRDDDELGSRRATGGCIRSSTQRSRATSVLVRSGFGRQ